MKHLLKNIEEWSVATLDKISGYKREKRKFYRAHGYTLNLKSPQSFNEKVVYKKIFDRNPLLPIVADKLQVRTYLKDTLGERLSNEISIPLIASYENAKSLKATSLPLNCVVKSNHGSGKNLIIRNGNKPSQKSLTKILTKWQKEVYGYRNHEWAYTAIPRRILVEELITDKKGNIPSDFKLHMIHGKCSFIKVDDDRHNDFKSTLYDTNWNKLKVAWRRPIGIEQPQPSSFQKMLDIAEALSKPFDFIRVDFYCVDDKIYFSEMTNYPSRGRGKFDPTDFDFEIGKLWHI